MKVVFLLALVCVVRSRTINQETDESGRNLEDGEQIWKGDMILTKEQAEYLYGKNPEISERDQNFNERADESEMNLDDGETIWEEDMILTKEQVKELYGKEPETSDQDENDISERHYPSDDFGDGFQILEGDMLLSKDQIQALYGQAQGRSANSEGRTLWPNGTVPYKIDPSAKWYKKNILEAIRKWEDVTCIKFVEYTGNFDSVNYINFWTNISTPGACYSEVGVSKNKNDLGQTLHLGTDCYINVATVIHEIGHAIGFFHEQSRMDRDNFVRILKENTDETKFKNNFEKKTSLHNYHNIPYDYGSLMHYGLDFFTINGKNTIIPYNPNHTLEIGQRIKLSFSDIKLANLMYNCSAKCSKKPLCKNEGFVDENCKCQCPEEYGGPNCKINIPPPVPACGGTVNTSGVVIQTPNYPSKPPMGTKCIWEFKAPAGKNVQVFFQHFNLIGRKYKKKTCYCDQVHIRGGGYNGENTYCEEELNAKTITISPHVNGTFVIFKACDPGKGYGGVFSANVTFT